MEQLSGLDSFMLYDEQGNVYNHVSALGIYDPETAPKGRTRFKEVLQHFKNRLPDYPVFRRRLVTVPYGLDRPYWVEDRAVDIEFHVRHIALPQPGDWRQLMIQVARLHSRPLDRSKPLWEIYVIDGLDKIPGLHAGCFALFLKVHHASADGQATATLMQALHSSNPHEVLFSSEQPLPQPDLETPSAFELLANAAKNSSKRTLGLSSLYLASVSKLSQVLWNKRPWPIAGAASVPTELPLSSAPLTRFNHPVSANRVVDAIALPMSDIKIARSAVPGSSVNDVFLCVCAGALRKYLSHKGELPDDSLRALTPFTLHDKTIGKRQHRGNNIGGAPVTLRTDIADAVERLHLIRHEAGNAKRAAEALGLNLLQGLLDNLPEAAGRPLLRHGLLRTINVAASNVLGPDTPLYVAGARLLHFYPVSIATDYVGLNMTGFSYNGVLWISSVACRNMLPDPSFFAECLRASFAELLAAAKQLAQQQPVTVLDTRSAQANVKRPLNTDAKPLPTSSKPYRTTARQTRSKPFAPSQVIAPSSPAGRLSDAARRHPEVETLQ